MRGGVAAAGETQNNHDEEKLEAAGGQPREGGESGVASALDQLAYVADMIDELRSMADSLRCATLTGVLEVARREAELEWRRRRDLSRYAPPGV